MTIWSVPRKYSPVPNTLDPYPPSDPSGAPGETGTGGGCGTTSELLGLRIGAGGTYGAGGTCADAIPTEKRSRAKDSKRVRKTCRGPYVYSNTRLCGINAFGIAEIAKGLFSCAEQSRVAPSSVSPRAALSTALSQAQSRSHWLRGVLLSSNHLVLGWSIKPVPVVCRRRNPNCE